MLRPYLFVVLGFFATLATGAFGQQVSSTCPAEIATEARPWLNAKYSPECRASYVVKTFKTLDEKLRFIGSFKNTGQGDPDMLAQLGLNSWKWSDGAAGVISGTGTTAFPTPLTVAASFDPEVAAKFGDLLGQESFDAGFSAMGGPAMDIARTWHFGRTTESFGEDPFLAASIATPEVKAIQSKHVMPTIKHFTAYTQERGRAGYQPIGLEPAVNVIVGEQALREIYFPAFRSAVINGGAGSVMCSFPQINGTYACDNKALLGVLKNEWHFDGHVMADFPDAQRDIVPAYLAGVDWGPTEPSDLNALVGFPRYTGLKGLREGLKDGDISLARIDDIALRRLVPAFRIGLFDYPAKRKADDISTQEARDAAALIVTQGSVLLKNRDRILPFDAKVRSIAVIGAQATEKALVVEQGSAHVAPTHLKPVISAIRERAGSGVDVRFAQGTLGLDDLPAIPVEMLKTPSGESGVQIEVFANTNLDFSGAPIATIKGDSFSIRSSPKVDGLPKDLQFSLRYTAQFTPGKSGVQHFSLSISGTGRLLINNKLMGRVNRADVNDTFFANVQMTAGQPVELKVEYTPREVFAPTTISAMGTKLGEYFNLGWAAPNDLMEQAVQAAKQADVAVVFVGAQVGEGMDRESLSLPNDQNALIAAVAAVNPRTVVVLNIGGAVTMPWLDGVAGVLQMWLPGDADGPAAAKLLFGDAEPGGRLPVTFPRDETQGPGVKAINYPGSLSPKGALADVRFDEGVFVGYRYWDKFQQDPLFPFGYGLSYSTFSTTNFSVRKAPDGSASVAVSVKNTGKRSGSEVVQVYVGFPEGSGEPPKQLKGFQKVTLAAGEAKDVRIDLPSDCFRYWDTKTHAWTTPAGSFHIMVGRSSREISYSQDLTPDVRLN